MTTVAKALIRNANGHYLLLRRSDTHPHYPLHLDLPGGEVEPGEEAIAGVVREIYEEAGITVPAESLELLFDTPVDEHRHVLFSCITVGVPEVTVSWEHESYEWYSPDTLIADSMPHNVDPYYAQVIAHIKNNYV